MPRRRNSEFPELRGEPSTWLPAMEEKICLDRFGTHTVAGSTVDAAAENPADRHHDVQLHVSEVLTSKVNQVFVRNNAFYEH